ncbi:MAG: hypothetical protein RMZ41_007170 [Nostoc sp. DedVER02]|nr:MULTISPECIES: hypothetical protein [unclassified Nostoc]MDZ7985513.1 hypothetical protein [Nostoc sp. DedVER02]MDZ8116979.1 hypothetical protein [Nostoc sp. DedVER01b]
MTTHIETHQINTELTLHDSSQSPLTLRAITLTPPNKTTNSSPVA